MHLTCNAFLCKKDCQTPKTRMVALGCQDPDLVLFQFFCVCEPYCFI